MATAAASGDLLLAIGILGQVLGGGQVPMIRYCEEIGLSSEAERSAGNQWLYGRRAQNRLTFIRHY